MSTLNQLRKKIEKIDAAIIKKLAEREKISKQIGLLKEKTGNQVTDLTRENDLMRYYENLCAQYGLESSMVKRLFEIIIVHSRNLQTW